MDEEPRFVVAAHSRQFLPFYHPQQEEWEAPFYFLQAADTQLGMQEKYVEKKQESGWTPEVLWTRQMVQDINAMTPKPKFLVICGDLVDAFPETEAETRNLQERDLKSVLAGLEVPLVCVCGNHDVGNTPTHATVASYRTAFGDDFFSFWCGGVFFLVVNSQYWEDSSKVEDLAEEQERWLDEQLLKVQEQKPKHVVVFQHIPFFICHPEEEKQYFNMELDLRHRLLQKFHDAGVRHVFCGHYHRNAGGHYKDLELVITSAVGTQLGEDTNGFRLVKVLDDRIEHDYYPLGAAPTRVALASPAPKPGTPNLPSQAWSRTTYTAASPPVGRKSSLGL